MAITIEQIKALRAKSGAGLSDVKKALEEANGDETRAMELIRERGKAIAAKRSERTAAEGCVLAGVNGNYAAIVALKCETDFVAKNEGHIKLTQDILNVALQNKPADLDALKAMKLDGEEISAKVTERSGVTGEKLELDFFTFVEGSDVVAYIHPGNKLATIVAFNQANVANDVKKEVAMQVAAMNPLSLDEASLPADVVEAEKRNAVEKAKQNQIDKAVEQALKKAGINPAHVDSEEHIESNIGKGWITAEDGAKAREIKKTVAAEKAANLPEQMIQNIAAGMVNKFFKENCLLNQEYNRDPKLNMTQYMDSQSKGLTVTAFKRFTLNAE
ncbi:MAG: elongation factor Ts [Paludibacteraceae bacterium]|jgi:elongation factor Ts|nr:elongation factor Ts [Paludibacteraceae bacterium]MBR6041108.1 elongation factor Ts [Paludibacteraceae bacterium]MBR6105241.1 elongation factor Ts [Paludibacteraceae bacterium]